MTDKVYDCNVWDAVGYHTEYGLTGWRIDVYECYDDVDYEHHDLPSQIIWLNNTQAEMLTLGKNPDEGGDYSCDTDFWIDPAGFLEVYKNIPRKVTRYLEALV
jgi:hypothetical protein